MQVLSIIKYNNTKNKKTKFLLAFYIIKWANSTDSLDFFLPLIPIDHHSW